MARTSRCLKRRKGAAAPRGTTGAPVPLAKWPPRERDRLPEIPGPTCEGTRGAAWRADEKGREGRGDCNIAAVRLLRCYKRFIAAGIAHCRAVQERRTGGWSRSRNASLGKGGDGGGSGTAHLKAGVHRALAAQGKTAQRALLWQLGVDLAQQGLRLKEVCLRQRAGGVGGGGRQLCHLVALPDALDDGAVIQAQHKLLQEGRSAGISGHGHHAGSLGGSGPGTRAVPGLPAAARLPR